MALTGEQRRQLKSLAHHLNPLIQIGQKGVTDALINAVDQALTDHELIKIRFMDFKDEKHDLADVIALKTSSDRVGIIGNVLTLFRRSPVEEKRHIVLSR